MVYFIAGSWCAHTCKHEMVVTFGKHLRTCTGKIVQSTLEECREAYAVWINTVLVISLGVKLLKFLFILVVRRGGI